MDFSGWGSPVNIIQTQMSMEMEGEIMRAVQNVGVIVDKEELVKAIQHDRGQYDKGFANGYNKAIDYFVKYIDECSGWTPNCIENDISLTVYTLHQIAEQLKAGGENDS